MFSHILMSRTFAGLICDTCSTSVSYTDNNIIGWIVYGANKVACNGCKPKVKSNETENH